MYEPEQEREVDGFRDRNHRLKQNQDWDGPRNALYVTGTLSGKKVDGRSDLFSLSVMLFRLSCGKLPFKGDSMATLMFQIANEPHPDILAIEPSLPASCVKCWIRHDEIARGSVRFRYRNGG